MSHIVPKSVYYRISIVLAVLLAATVVIAEVDLGPWNVSAALAIAAAKAVLIALFFMHLRYETSLVRLFAAGGFLWLTILFVFVAADVLSRGTP